MLTRCVSTCASAPSSGVWKCAYLSCVSKNKHTVGTGVNCFNTLLQECDRIYMAVLDWIWLFPPLPLYMLCIRTICKRTFLFILRLPPVRIITRRSRHLHTLISYIPRTYASWYAKSYTLSSHQSLLDVVCIIRLGVPTSNWQSLFHYPVHRAVSAASHHQRVWYPSTR